MDENINYIEVVERARAGDQESLDSLAQLAAEQLYAYVYRIVLEQDLTEDILQESILEMFKILGKLEKADRFWPWLYRIALNKVHSHYRRQRRRGEVLRKMAEMMGRSELSCRVLFYRSKKALERQLSRRGLGKGAVVKSLTGLRFRRKPIFQRHTGPAAVTAAISPKSSFMAAMPMVM